MANNRVLTALLTVRRCGRTAVGQGEENPPFVSETPRGQHYELFPDLPASTTAVLTCSRGSPWEKIHVACGHF